MSTTKEYKPRSVKLYCADEMEPLLRGVRVAACMLTEPQQPVVDEASVLSRVAALTLRGVGAGSVGAQCSCCGATFESRAQQIAHYKHHWHAHNIKRKLFGKPALTLAAFNNRDDNSSVSGSDSEADDGGSDAVSDLFAAATRHCKAFFTNAAGEVFCMYRCILHHRKENLSTDGSGHAWTARCSALAAPGALRWAVLMVSGGHFAGAVFSGGVATLHKTLHSYVVRRGQGHAQGTRDQQGNAPKSAGASLRRYNQAQFTQHVQEILASWSDELAACSLVLYRAVGPANQLLLFGKPSPLTREDPRLRAFPFPTRKPTFKEVQRAHATVSNVEVYDTMELFQKALIASSVPAAKSADPERSRKPKTSPSKPIDRAKSREPIARELPTQILSSEDEGPCFIDSETPIGWIKTLSEQSSNGVITNSRKDLLNDHGVLDRESLDGDSESEKKGIQGQQKKKKKAKTKAEEPKQKKIEINIPDKIKNLWKAIKSGESNRLETVVESWAEEELQRAVNTADPSDGNTALHKAALAACPDMIRRIMSAGGDPCVRNHAMQTPYVAGEDKDTRLAFRFFQGEFPDKYNYAKAHVPGPLTAELLAAEEERKAAARRAKRQRDKDRQAEKGRASKFLELSDADKARACAAAGMAAAAAAAAAGAEAAARCFTCGARLGATAFAYDAYQFCSTRCLQAHRAVRPLNLPA